MDLIEKLVKQLPFTDKDIEIELYEICDREHASCNSNCPVYKRNGNKIPDTAHDFKVNRGCDCFKSGSKMVEFLKQH